MFIRYHLIYDAIGCLLLICALYVHYLFYITFFIYVMWLYKRFDYRYVLILFVFLFIILLPSRKTETLPSIIAGQVVKIEERGCYLKTSYGKVKVLSDYPFHYHDYIKCRVTPLKMNVSTNDYAFDEQVYLYSQKVFYKVKATRILSCQSHPSLYGWILKRLSSNKNINMYQKLLLLGVKDEHIQDDYQSLIQFSLVHLFALSGMHIHILYRLFTQTLGLFFKQHLSQLISLSVLGIYIFSIPMQISLYRAFFMLFLSYFLKQWFHELDILSILIIGSLMYNPYIIYNLSFIYSYFIYFIVLLTRSFKNAWIYIYVSSLPIVMFYQFQIPLTALLIGNIFVPFIEGLYCLCLFSIILPIINPLLLIMIQCLQHILVFLKSIYIWIPMSRPSLSFIVMFYILYFMIICKVEMKKSIQREISIMLALILSFSIYSKYKIYGEITMIDVGQGDCVLVTLPMNQGNIMIDTGGNRHYDLAKTTLIPYLKARGIGCLDFVYISHDDYDHCGALTSLQENFCVQQIIDTYESERQIGPLKIKMLKENHRYQDKNDNSLVMLMEYKGTNTLMTGDISSCVEKDLLEKYGKLDIDILKVAHHGSRTSTSANLFEMIQPQIAMIGVGKNNNYRHPSLEVINRLKRKDTCILRTDEDGMFHIRFYGKQRYILR